MTDAASSLMPVSADHHLLDRIAVWIALAVAGGLFFTLGWMVLSPDDPSAPVSLLARSGALSAWVQSLGLACVVGVLATVLGGRRATEFGVFSACVGLTLVSLRGGTIDALLYRAADPATWTERHFAIAFAGEAMSWSVLVGILTLVCGLVSRWCFGGSGSTSEEESVALGGRSARSNRSADRDARFAVVPRSDGLRHAGVVLIVSLIGFRVFSTGLYSRAIEHGQVCFVVAASVAMGVYVAMRVFPVDSPMWSLPSAMLFGIVGYLGAGFAGGVETAHPANIPVSHFLRILPVQAIAVSVIAAIATFGNMRAPGGDMGPASTAQRGSRGRAVSPGVP